ncbi:MAG TPA: ribokinase [Pirellulales bacterium]|jgi:ribokinase|nr:ribokinase [Pirellulales bacterium]
MASSRVVVLGSVNVDLVVRGPRLPRPGETVLGGEFYQAAGGKGANQAVAAARAAREPVTFLACVGDDDYGRRALANFRAENLDVDHLKIAAGIPTGVALILVDARGENLIGVASGANMALSAADVDALPDDVFQGPGVFLTCLESPLETVQRGLQRAKRAGRLTILNPAPANPAILQSGLAPLVDILTPNEGEAALLAGAANTSRCDPAAAGRRLQALGFNRCVITLGAQGCMTVEEETILAPGRAVSSIDATGAGDAFNGALAVALAEGRSLADAARWANAAAAIAVTRLGAQPSLPTRQEIDQFVDR